MRAIALLLFALFLLIANYYGAVMPATTEVVYASVYEADPSILGPSLAALDTVPSENPSASSSGPGSGGGGTGKVT